MQKLSRHVFGTKLSHTPAAMAGAYGMESTTGRRGTGPDVPAFPEDLRLQASRKVLTTITATAITPPQPAVHRAASNNRFTPRTAPNPAINFTSPPPIPPSK